MSVSDVEKAFGQIEEVDAVISTIGGTPANPKADSEVCLHHSLWLGGTIFLHKVGHMCTRVWSHEV